MGWMDIIYLLVMISLCVLVIKSDLSEGMVYNKTLLIYGAAALVLDIVYYGFFQREMIIPFVINSVVVSITALILFYTHCFAGGDCKLLMILVLLFPANCYMTYGNSLITMVFTIGFAVFYGYLYLLVSSIYSLIKKKNSMSGTYVKTSLLVFVKSFLCAMIYISGVNLIIRLIATQGIIIPVWIIRIICIGCSLLVGKKAIFRKKWMLGIAILIDIALSVMLKMIPFSIHPENYILVVALLVCQLTIRTSLYEEIPVSDLKKGLILTMGATMMMQTSRVRGLPGISSEDLRNRLTEEEAESVKRWAKGKKVETITIVKKIPFAAFIACGFISYWIFWGIVL